MSDIDDLISRYQLQPHPEGGFYRETWRDKPDLGRGSGTAILYLLPAGQESWWHRVDAVEIWHYYGGASLELRIDDETPREVSQSSPQAIVPAHAWQYARSTGDYTLVGCTVSPAFELSGFELASRDWRPPRRDGTHQLNGPYVLVQYQSGKPMRYMSLGQGIPTESEQKDIKDLIEAFSGFRVRLSNWEVEPGDPRDNGHHATVEVIA